MASQAGRDSIKSSTRAKRQLNGTVVIGQHTCHAVLFQVGQPFRIQTWMSKLYCPPCSVHRPQIAFQLWPEARLRPPGCRAEVSGSRLASAHSRSTACHRALGSRLWGKGPYRRHFPGADAGWMACVGTRSRRAGEPMRCRIRLCRIRRSPGTIREWEDVSLHVRTRFPQVRAGDGGTAVHMLAVKMGRG